MARPEVVRQAAARKAAVRPEPRPARPVRWAELLAVVRPDPWVARAVEECKVALPVAQRVQTEAPRVQQVVAVLRAMAPKLAAAVTAVR